jgi:hypothetical protein
MSVIDHETGLSLDIWTRRYVPPLNSAHIFREKGQWTFTHFGKSRAELFVLLNFVRGLNLKERKSA